MTLYEFNQLTEEGKQEAMRRAVMIADRTGTDCEVYLFQLDGFYIETYCYREGHERDHYRTFRSMTELEPYLQRIEINL